MLILGLSGFVPSQIFVSKLSIQMIEHLFLLLIISLIAISSK